MKTLIITVSTIFLLTISACSNSTSVEELPTRALIHSTSKRPNYFPIYVEEIEIKKRVVNDSLTQYDTLVIRDTVLNSNTDTITWVCESVFLITRREINGLDYIIKIDHWILNENRRNSVDVFDY